MKSDILRIIPRSILSVVHDKRGVALIEFTFAVPVLLLLFVASYQLSDAISAYRKVTMSTRTIADITSQYISVNDTDLDTILNASQQVMSPYDPARATMTVTQVKIDASGNATVDWSRGKNSSGLIAGSSFNLPNSIKQPDTSLIVAETIYNYTPSFASSMIGSISMKDQIIMSPRVVESIEKIS